MRFIEHDGASFEEDVVIPAQVDENYMLYSKTQAAAPSGNPFRVTAFDNALEVEPNDEQAKATPVTLGEPFALNGIIEKAGDVDYFKVTLKKGLKVEVQAFAQLLGSPLDSVVNIYNDKGASLAGNDDGGGRRRLDSKMTVSIPADGDYFVRVTDQLERGGPNFVYRIEMVASQPSLVFASPQYVVNDTHIRQFIAIPKGRTVRDLGESLAATMFQVTLSSKLQGCRRGQSCSLMCFRRTSRTFRFCSKLRPMLHFVVDASCLSR